VSAEATVVLERSGRRPQAPGDDGAAVDYGSFIPHAARQLDDLARSLGVPTLSSFHWADPEMLEAMLADLEGPAREKLARVMAEQREWHEAAEGRRTVAALIDALNGPGAPALPVRGGAGAVLRDLRALATILGATEERFHLESL
jgi:hypothetical protein